MKKIIKKKINIKAAKSEKYEPLKKYLRLANYLSAAQLYLRDNFFLEDPLKVEHLKDRLLGHWGGATGITFILAHLNFFIRESQNKNELVRDIMFTLGPGHAFPALQTSLFLERVLTEFFGDNKSSKRRFSKNIYDFEITYDKKGIGNMIKYFGTPVGFPTHASPVTPGAILEGGELGYSISNASGSVLDNPYLINVCVVGDGEAETASLATSWHSSKFINSKTNGVVLPIFNLNGYKISGPTIFGRMSDSELLALFTGYGYEPHIIDARSDTRDAKSKDNYDQNKDSVHILMQEALTKSFTKIAKMKKTGETKGLPMIILKSDKGWTGPKSFAGVKIEGNNESHQVPFANAKNNEKEFLALENWLRSYKIEELFADRDPLNLKTRFKNSGELFLKEIEDILPEKMYRPGNNIHVQQHGKGKLRELSLPKLETLLSKAAQQNDFSPMKLLGEYMSQVFKLNEGSKNFRFFSPDETYSNKLDAVFKEESRGWLEEGRLWDKDLSKNGRIIEMLSENTLIGIMMGYILTGRHAFFASYEAFVQVVASMIDQYLKFLRVAIDVPWRGDVSGFNIVLTAPSWSQEHNGYSHQNPGFIDDMLMRNTDIINVYFPADAIATAYATEMMMKSKNVVNVLCAGKDDRPILLTRDEAQKSVTEGLCVIQKYSDERNKNNNFDLVVTAAGDYMSLECIAGIDLINKIFKEQGKVGNGALAEKRNRVKIGFLSIGRLTSGDMESKKRNEFLSTLKNNIGKAKVFASFHGHPQSLERYFYEAEFVKRDVEVRGYIERGGITTLLAMHILNKTSRYHVAEWILKNMLEARNINEKDFEILSKDLSNRRKIEEYYIAEYFADSKEIKEWKWGE